LITWCINYLGVQNNILFVILQDVHDWKEPGVDRLPLPEKAAKARAILARTNASTINAYEHVCNDILFGKQLWLSQCLYL
jgi:hypothetical protein